MVDAVSMSLLLRLVCKANLRYVIIVEGSSMINLLVTLEKLGLLVLPIIKFRSIF